MKNKKRTGFIIAGATVITGLVIAGVSIYANAAIKVNSFTVEKNDVSQEVELNGKFESDLTETMYANTNGLVKNVHVKVGDTVKKGDLLISFDEERIDYLMAVAEYDNQSCLGNYSNSIEMGNRTQALYNEANVNLGVLNQQIVDTQNRILELEKKIAARRAAFAGEGAALQKSIIDTTSSIQEQAADTEKKDDTDYSEQLANLQKLAQGSAYNQQYDEEILKMQEEINRLTADLTNYKEYKAEMTSQKAATATSRMTEGQKEQLEAMKAQSELTTEDTLKNLELAKDGIRAEFDGIVTGINVEEGSEVSRGMSLISVASTNDIIVKCNANKYDIMSIEEGQNATVRYNNKEYTGSVSRIERIAGGDGNSVGVGVEVKIDNPDDAVILGMDVKSKINIAAVEGVLAIPREAYVEEDNESYVFVLKDKKASRKKVEAGVKNDDMIEVVSGLSEGDVVIWNEESEIKEGMDVRSTQ